MLSYTHFILQTVFKISRTTMNAVFTKRDGCQVLMYFENLIFICVNCSGRGYLYAADEMTANLLGCKINELRGAINSFSAKDGLQKIQFDFCVEGIAYEQSAIFTYQTSCLPFLMSFLHPGKNML